MIPDQFLPVQLVATGPSAELHRKASELMQKVAQVGWHIAKSDIEGDGVFASRDYIAGDRIGLALTEAGKDDGGNDQWNLTVFAQHCNHQTKCNTLLVPSSDGASFDLIAKEDIEADTELTVDYMQVTKQIGFSSEMLWEGKAVPSVDLATYIEKG